MACYKPLTAYLTNYSTNYETGKLYRRVTFDSKNPDIHSETQLPCGKCVGCRLERSRQWAVRCMHEAKMHEQNSFITLTYSDQNLPENNSLNHRDVQLFLKRLRFTLGKKVRYYMCGEYGENFGRPHYHIVLFGHDFEDKKYFFKSPSGSRVYRSETLEKLWPLGHSSLGDVNFESAAYVARYVMKKITGEQAKTHYGETTSQETGEIKLKKTPEYNKMSLKPGIGQSWLDKYHQDVYPSDQVIIRNKPTKPPRFYDKKYSLFKPIEFEAIQHNREKEARKNYLDNTPERLAVKEKVTEAKLNKLKRKLA